MASIASMDGVFPALGGRFSVVVEMENARTVDRDEVVQTLSVLAEQMAQVAQGQDRPQVILAHPGTEADSAPLGDAVCRAVPRLREVARLEVVAVPGGRYYELKNAGFARADGEVVVLLDSDTLPEAGWLQRLLAPFEDPRVAAVSGHTYLRHYDFVSRTLALVWLFPLRHGDERAAQRRALNANNAALRRATVGRTPFPIDHGFKVSCSKLMRHLETQGFQLVRVPAYAAHAPLTGWRFLVWRALVTGRDADRRYAALKSPAWCQRLAAALGFLWRMPTRALRRVLRLHREVQMPWYEVPLAVMLGCGFYILAGLANLLRLCTAASDGPEQIPAYAEHS